MNHARISAIAAEFVPFLKGDNDAIADDPRRWNEKLTSWSAEEAASVVAALITKAVNEAIEECREAVLEEGRTAEVAKDLGIDPASYLAGYQDGCVDCDEAIRGLLPGPLQ